VNSNRAVAEGSVSFFLENHVHFRIARFTYGVKCTREFEHNRVDHERRRGSALVNPSGIPVLPNGYQMILKKVSVYSCEYCDSWFVNFYLQGTKVAEDREFSRVFAQESNDLVKLNYVSCDITCYKGSASDPQWIDSEPGKLSTSPLDFLYCWII
jgi:hypothetical protein